MSVARHQTLLEPHDRGAILVAAVFDAFISIYEKRVADLFRIATGGTGVLQEGALHPDLVNRLAVEAAKSAQHVLNMCIRALDYCPPVDITFGDYLRAMITADSDLVPDDDRGYRIAVIEAFRRRGIYPRDVRTLSVDSLRWQQIRDAAEEEDLQFIAGKLRGLLQEMKDYAETRRDTFLQRSAPGGRKAKSAGDGGCARVRMYRQGLGDCFLLSFPGEAQPVHMLIDCGVILGTQNPKPITQKVVADIKDATGGRLDVLVATHEHWVHLSGFIQAREIFDDMTIDEIWFAWTEDPGNDLAQQLKKERADRLNSLHVALERWQASGLQPRGAFGVASLLGFFGEPLAAANDNNTGAALKYLTTRKDAKIRYFEPGQSLTVKGASGARLYVLGPPQDARLIRKSSPTKTGREVYEETGLSIAVEAGFFAALRLGAAEGPGTDDRLSYPFDPYYHVTPSQAEQHGDLKKYYSSDASWRRIPSRCAGGELGVLADAAVAGERQ